MSEVMRNTVIRIGAAVIGLPLYFFLLYTDALQSACILVVSIIISIICLIEYYQIVDKGEGKRPFFVVGICAGVLVNILMYLYAFGRVYGYNKYVGSFDARIIFIVLSLFIVCISLIQIFKRPIEGGIYALAVTVFGVVYIVFSFSHVILMKGLKNGFSYIIILNIAVMLNDIFAYFGGVFFGKHKANIAVSPNKSWEGYFSGLLFTVIGMIVMSQFFSVVLHQDVFSFIEAVFLGIVLSILGHSGDLIESAIKRDGDIKDSGSIIPGHGGMWDVFDALIFVFPIFYYYLVLKGVQ